MDIKAELFFLIVKLLEDEGCTEASEILKKFIDSKNLLPSRINTLGKPFKNNFEHYERVHGSLKHSMLFDYFRLLLDLLSDKSRCSSYVGTLIGLQNQIVRGNIMSCTEARGFDISYSVHKNFRQKMLHTMYGKCSYPQHILAHRTAIYCMEFDQRGDYIITGSDDYTIKIWSLCTPNGEHQCNLRHTLRGHVAEIIEVAVSSDNHLLASVDSNSCLIVWCLKTGQPLVAVRGSRINRVLSGLCFVSTRVKYKTCRESHEDGFNGLDSGVSGLIVISSYGGYLHIIPYEHQVHLIHNNMLNDWKCCIVHLLPAIRFTTAPEGTPNVYWPSIACLDISPGGLLIAAGCSDQRIRLYSLSNPLKPEAAGVLAAHEESVNSVAFSHFGLKLATGSSNGGSCWLWKFQAGQWRSMALQFRKKLKCRPCHLIWSSQDRYLIASMKNGSVYVYFGESGQLATVIEGHEGAIHALSLSPFDEDILATAGVDGRFQLWNIAHHRRFHQTETDRPSCSLNTQSSKNPLLLHYRFPPGELDPTIGLVWHFFEPGEDQPLWHGANNRRNQIENSITSHTHETTRDSFPNSTIRTSNTQRPTLTRNGTSSKMQKITACKALPTSDGIGFVVVTKSGLMSIFRPSEFVENFDPTLIDTLQPIHTQVDEQFLHWELDTAQWKEVAIHERNPVDRRIAEQVALVLGSPPASQSASALPGGRSEVSNLNSEQEQPNMDVTVSSSHRQSSQPENSLSYKSPPSVLFEIIHVPSMVPFHRLPPGYLTNLRGIPYPPRRQTKVPGRENPISPHDLIPSITIDEETGEDIVVDDIQFCPDPPSGYCPNPVQTPVRRIPGKNYMWCSHWLNVHPSLIEPLNSEELAIKIEEQTKVFEEELHFFSAGGEPLVSFGDQYMTCKSSVPQTLVMQPYGLCFRTSSLSSKSETQTTTHVPTLSIGSSNSTQFDANPTQDDLLSEPQSRGLSFLHSFLCKQRSIAASSKPIPDAVSNIGLSGSRTGTDDPLNVSISNCATENAEAAPPTADDIEDADDPVDTSEESEWSETVDVEIGWWHRQRRRRNRRILNASELPIASEPANINLNSNHDLEAVDNFESQISPNTGTILTSGEIPGSNVTDQNTHRRSLQCRRSVRQQRRMIAKRRLLREMQIADVRAAKMEGEKRQAAARRSKRFRHCQPNDADMMDEDTTSRDTSLPDATECVRSELTMHEPSDNIIIPNDISSRRERLKRRLIRSVDYALRTHSRLPLNRGPTDGYQGPDCEGEVYAVNHSLLPNLEISPWIGPHFDWLSTLDPIPSPYIPQVGDSVVYLVHGHRDYVTKAWESGELPALGLQGLNFETDGTSSEFNTPNQMPWLVWPDIPHIVCCQLVDINYHIVRIADTHADNSRFRTNRPKSDYPRKRSTRRPTSRVRQCTRSTHTKGMRLSNSENRINTDSNSHSSDSPRLGGDSFVRLVVLCLKIDENQPYHKDVKPEHMPTTSMPNSTRPNFINVIYHDVDGILEFVILRHVFDAALDRKWQPGDAFICPVGEVWWRGRVLQDFNHNPLYSSTSSAITNLELQPSTSATSINPQPCMESDTSDPWLAFLVRWLGESESMTDKLTENDHETILCAMCSPGSLKRLPENVDRLSAWDMHPWYPEPSDSGLGFYGGLQGGFIHVSPEQLRAVYGTSARWIPLSTSCSNDRNAQVKDLERVIRCVKQISDLPISEAFRNPVDLVAYPDYLFVNPYPVDLGFILNRLGSGYYRQKAAVKADFQQLLNNTIRYNRPDSSIVQNAQILYELGVMSLETEVENDSILAKYQELIWASTSPKPKPNYEPSSFVRSNIKPKIKIDSDTEHADSSHAEDTDIDMNAISTRCQTPNSPIAKIPSNVNEDANSAVLELNVCQNSVSSSNNPIPDYSVLDVLPKDVWIPCSRSLIKSLISNRRSYFFRQPIDLDEYPDYSVIVENPMDLQTILDRLDNSERIRSVCRSTRRGSAKITNYYETVLDLFNDLNLIVSNSKLYNTDPDTQVHSDTLWLDDWIRNILYPNLKLCLEKTHTDEELESSRTLPQSRIKSNSVSYAKQSSFKQSKYEVRSKINKIAHHRKIMASKYIFSRSQTEPRSESSDSNVSSNKSHEILRTSSGRIVRQRSQGNKEINPVYIHESDSEQEAVSPLPRSSRRKARIKSRRPRLSLAATHRTPELKKRPLHRSKPVKHVQNTIRRSTRVRRTTSNLCSYYLCSDLDDDFDDNDDI